MTHSLHRAGTPANLAEDYTVLCMPSRGINVEGSDHGLRRFLEIALAHGATNIGDINTGSAFQTDQQAILDNVVEGTIVHAVLPGREAALNTLRDLKREDLGLSVVLQGLCSEIQELAREVGLKPHTMNHSLGRWGKVELLPDPEVLEIATMCGHGLVSASLVVDLAERIARGKMSAESAATTLAKQCVCGIFNPERARKLLKQLADAH